MEKYRNIVKSDRSVDSEIVGGGVALPNEEITEFVLLYSYGGNIELANILKGSCTDGKKYIVAVVGDKIPRPEYVWEKGEGIKQTYTEIAPVMNDSGQIVPGKCSMLSQFAICYHTDVEKVYVAPSVKSLSMDGLTPNDDFARVTEDIPNVMFFQGMVNFEQI